MFFKQKSTFCNRTVAATLLALGLLLSIASGCDRGQSLAAELPVPKVTTAEVVQQETTDLRRLHGQNRGIRGRRYSCPRVWLSEVDRIQRRRFRQRRANAVHDRARRIRGHPQSIALEDRRLGIQSSPWRRRIWHAAKAVMAAVQGRGQPGGIRTVRRCGPRSRSQPDCGASRCKSNRSRSEVHRRQSADQRPNRSRHGFQRYAADRRHGLRHIADENRRRAADVCLLRRR